MPAWREWLLGDRGRSPKGGTAVGVAADLWERAGRRDAAVLPLVREVEETALKVYADHGLPTRTGHYQRGPGATEWTWLAEELPTDLRWAMVLERPPEAGWRYAMLEDIGRFPGASAELLGAARLLATCRHLKARLQGRTAGDPGEDIQTAIRLGADWRSLQDAMAWRETARLKLTTPSDALPAPSEAPSAKRPARAKGQGRPRKPKPG